MTGRTCDITPCPREPVVTDDPAIGTLCRHHRDKMGSLFRRQYRTAALPGPVCPSCYDRHPPLGLHSPPEGT